jgi:hypothetical protein
MCEREKGVCFVVVERVEEVVFPREGTEEKLIVLLFSPSLFNHLVVLFLLASYGKEGVGYEGLVRRGE